MMLPPDHGTRYAIAVGGRPLIYRDVKAIAIATAQDIKTRNLNAEVTVRDLYEGEIIVVDLPVRR